MLGRIFFLWSLWVLSSQCYAEVVTINRVLLKINDSAYTQRELENYLIVKALHTSQRDLVANAQNWVSAVRVFKNDMLVYEESRKLRYTTESLADLPEKVRAIRSAIQADKELTELAARLLLSDKDIELILRILIRIDKYKLDTKEASFETVGVPPRRRVPFLDKRFFVQIYDDAMTYRVIQPQAFKIAK